MLTHTPVPPAPRLLLDGMEQHAAGGGHIIKIDELSPAEAHAAHPRLVDVAEVQVVGLVLLDVVEQRPAARLGAAGHHVEAQVLDGGRHVRAEHVHPRQASDLGGELVLGLLGDVRPGATREPAADEADAQPVHLDRLAVEVPNARAQQVTELLREVGVAVRQVGAVGEGREHRLVLRPAGGADQRADLRLPPDDAGAQHLAGLVEVAGAAQLDETPGRLGAVDVRHDPLEGAVVDEVEQVAADEQHVDLGRFPAELLGGTVDVRNDLDMYGGSLRLRRMAARRGPPHATARHRRHGGHRHRYPGSSLTRARGGWRAAAEGVRGGNLRVQLPAVARPLLSARAAPGRMAPVLRRGLRGGRAGRHLLPTTGSLGGRLLGGGAARPLRAGGQGAASHHPRGAARGRGRRGHAARVRALARAARRPAARGRAAAPAEPGRGRGARAPGAAARHAAAGTAGGGRGASPLMGPALAGRPAAGGRRRAGPGRPARRAALAGLAGAGPLPATARRPPCDPGDRPAGARPLRRPRPLVQAAGPRRGGRATGCGVRQQPLRGRRLRHRGGPAAPPRSAHTRAGEPVAGAPLAWVRAVSEPVTMAGASVVIVGGGVMGCSIAFHLAERGTDVLLLEGGTGCSGMTARSGALVRMHYTNQPEARMALASLAYFRDWRERVGGWCGFTVTGFVTLVGPGDAEHPELDLDGIGLAAVEPGSGYADPVATTFSFASRAVDLGARIRQGVRVRAIRTVGGRVTGLDTSEGEVGADAVVLACGPWVDPLARTAGFDLGITPERAQVAFFRRPRAARRHPV